MEEPKEAYFFGDGPVGDRNTLLLYGWRRMFQCVLHEGVRVLQAGGGTDAAALACLRYLREAVATMRLVGEGFNVGAVEDVSAHLDMAVIDEMCVNNFGAINPLPADLLPGLRHCIAVARDALREELRAGPASAP